MAESSPGRSPAKDSRDEPVPQGRLKITQDAILGYPSSRMNYSRFERPAHVANRHSRVVQVHPGLTSWGILSRPCRTARRQLLTQDERPGLLSAVPSGLNLFTQTLKPLSAWPFAARLKAVPFVELFYSRQIRALKQHCGSQLLRLQIRNQVADLCVGQDAAKGGHRRLALFNDICCLRRRDRR